MRFKKGDEVFIKGIFQESDGDSFLSDFVEHEHSGGGYFCSQDLMTKEEMLGYLNKPEAPEAPKVGQVWQWKETTEQVKVIYLNDLHVGYEYLKNKSVCGIRINSFLKSLTRVSE